MVPCAPSRSAMKIPRTLLRTTTSSFGTANTGSRTACWNFSKAVPNRPDGKKRRFEIKRTCNGKEQEHDLHLERKGRPDGGRLLCETLSRQRRERRSSCAQRLSVRKGWRRDHRRVHGRRHSLSRPQRRGDV